MPETSGCSRPTNGNAADGNNNSNSLNSTHNSSSRGGAGGNGGGEGKTEWRSSAVRIQHNWSEQLSSKNRLYYYNCRTETSQWVKPVEWSLPDLSQDELQHIIRQRQQQALLKQERRPPIRRSRNDQPKEQQRHAHQNQHQSQHQNQHQRQHQNQHQNQHQSQHQTQNQRQANVGDSRLLQRIKETRITLDARQEGFSSLMPSANRQSQQQQQNQASDDMDISPRHDPGRTPKTLKRKASEEQQRLSEGASSSRPAKEAAPAPVRSSASSASSASSSSAKTASTGAGAASATTSAAKTEAVASTVSAAPVTSSARAQSQQQSTPASASLPATQQPPRPSPPPPSLAQPLQTPAVVAEPPRPGREYLRSPEPEDLAHAKLDSPDLLAFVDHRFVGKFDDRQAQRMLDQAAQYAAIYNRISGVFCCDLSAQLKKLRSLVRIAEVKATVQDQRRLSLHLMQQPQTPSTTHQAQSQLLQQQQQQQRLLLQPLQPDCGLPDSSSFPLASSSSTSATAGAAATVAGTLTCDS